MTLAQVPSNGVCQIVSVGLTDDRDLKYLRNGVQRGGWLQVVCRHPSTDPLVLEVKLENLLHISLPVAFANRVQVRLVDFDREGL